MAHAANRPFQQDAYKNAQNTNDFLRPQSMVRADTISEERRQRYIEWITFFRRNPHRFIELYFGIKLHPYQVLIIFCLQRSMIAYLCASRAAAKTWIIAVWSLTLAVLYPGIQVVCAAKTLKQSGIIISEKLYALRENHPNVSREIRTLTANSNVYEAIFHCGSTIRVVTASENARGTRAGYLVVDEAKNMDKNILDSVLKPFLTVRMPPYRSFPEYANDPDLVEEGRITYMTSAWYKAEYWYKNLLTVVKKMVLGDTTFNFLAFDYLISIYHGIKTRAMIKAEMADNLEVTNLMEYYNVPSSISGKAYFSLKLFSNNRNIKKAFYPQKDDTYVAGKNPYNIPLVENELRILGIDISSRAGRTNDQSAIACIRLLPVINKGYERYLVYMETFKGVNTITQARRIKDIFQEFSGNYIVIDAANVGISVIDALSQITVSEEKGITYPPMTVVGDEFADMVDQRTQLEVRNRTLGLNALPVIFPITASQAMNSEIAVAFRVSLQKKLWHFLIPDNDAEEFLIKTNKEFTKDANDPKSFGFFMNPYVQTNFLITETVNLDMKLINGMIKLEEKAGNTKDRYSAVSYANYIISKFDLTLMKEKEDKDEFAEFMALIQSV